MHQSGKFRVKRISAQKSPHPVGHVSKEASRNERFEVNWANCRIHVNLGKLGTTFSGAFPVLFYCFAVASTELCELVPRQQCRLPIHE